MDREATTRRDPKRQGESLFTAKLDESEKMSELEEAKDRHSKERNSDKCFANGSKAEENRSYSSSYRSAHQNFANLILTKSLSLLPNYPILKANLRKNIKILTVAYKDSLYSKIKIHDSNQICWTLDELRVAQSKDKLCILLNKYIENKLSKEEEKILKKSYKQYNKFTHKSIDSIIYREVIINNRIVQQQMIPESMTQWALNLIHDTPTAGHRGLETTQRNLDSFAYMPKSKQLIEKHIKTCLNCIQFKRKYGAKVPSSPMKLPTRPWSRTHCDLIGPLPKSKDGHVYILTLIDAFTRFLIVVPLRNKSANVVAKALFERVISQYGPMNTIISDQGSEYVSQIWKDLVDTWKINHVTTASYSPSSNGCCERVNSSLIQILTSLVTNNIKIWSQMLYYATYAYNTAYHSAIKDTPYF